LNLHDAVGDVSSSVTITATSITYVIVLSTTIIKIITTITVTIATTTTNKYSVTFAGKDMHYIEVVCWM
jgi:hypothetical protein